MISPFSHRALYAAFDVFPATKGAAVHIHHMAHTLFSLCQGGMLYVLGHDRLPSYQREDGIEIFRFSDPIPNFLERVMGFGRRLQGLLEQHAHSLRICHFRDPWSGVPILTHRDRGYMTVYEMNGLPSIELPSAYPLLSPQTLDKIRQAERLCWTQADSIITPSDTMQQNLVRLGVPASKITVIPNGASVPTAASRPSHAPSRYLIYCGALQSWQGIESLFRAFAYLSDLPGLALVMCSAVQPRKAKPYRKLAEKLGIADRIHWYFQLPQETLTGWLSHAALSIAPLTECARNLEQGCCPLKILESMAAGVPVVASDLPSVRELMTDGVHGRLVRPDRPDLLARTIRILLEYPEQRQAMGQAAQQRIAQDYTWEQSLDRLAIHYRTLHPEVLTGDTGHSFALQPALEGGHEPLGEDSFR
ncbi:MAG: glycosyltransferase family 4 protein [Candidatus Tectomicrobia bacterium]